MIAALCCKSQTFSSSNPFSSAFTRNLHVQHRSDDGDTGNQNENNGNKRGLGCGQCGSRYRSGGGNIEQQIFRIDTRKQHAQNQRARRLYCINRSHPFGHLCLFARLWTLLPIPKREKQQRNAQQQFSPQHACLCCALACNNFSRVHERQHNDRDNGETREPAKHEHQTVLARILAQEHQDQSDNGKRTERNANGFGQNLTEYGKHQFESLFQYLGLAGDASGQSIGHC